MKKQFHCFPCGQSAVVPEFGIVTIAAMLFSSGLVEKRINHLF